MLYVCFYSFADRDSQGELQVSYSYGNIRYVMCDFLLVFYLKFVLKTHRFFIDISPQKMWRPWKPGQRSLKVIESCTI